jgi:hypothetical protein
MFLPVCIVLALIDASSGERPAFWFYVCFGSLWGLIWIQCTLTQLQKLRVSRFWILPMLLLLTVLAWLIGGLPAFLRWILSSGVLILQIVFICLPPREASGQTTNTAKRTTP